MRHIREPFTLPVHGDLQHEINDMIIAIKLHHTIKDNDENVVKARATVMQPTWENVTELLRKAYDALNKERYNPIKY